MEGITGVDQEITKRGEPAGPDVWKRSPQKPEAECEIIVHYLTFSCKMYRLHEYTIGAWTVFSCKHTKNSRDSMGAELNPLTPFPSAWVAYAIALES